jgi:hypothetical protein
MLEQEFRREPQRKPQHKPRGISKWERKEKARQRRDFAPTGDQMEKTRERARKRLNELNAELSGYIPPLKDAEDQSLLHHPELLAEKINTDFPGSWKIALDFAESLWIENVLDSMKRDELFKILNKFVNACSEDLQKYLEERSGKHGETRLQEAKNRVINPITGQLDIK